MRGFPGYIDGSSPIYSVGGASILVEIPAATPTLFPLPPLDNGNRPPFIVLTGPAVADYFKIGDATVDGSPAAGGIQWQAADMMFPIHTRGYTHISVYSTNGTIGNPIHITPLAESGIQNFKPRAFSVGTSPSVTMGTLQVATTEIPIPNSAGGKRAKVVRVHGRAQAYCRPGFAGGDVHTVRDGVRLKSSYPLMLNVSGYTHLLCSNVVIVSANVTVSPVEIY